MVRWYAAPGKPAGARKAIGMSKPEVGKEGADQYGRFRCKTSPLPR